MKEYILYAPHTLVTEDLLTDSRIISKVFSQRSFVRRHDNLLQMHGRIISDDIKYAKHFEVIGSGSNRYLIIDRMGFDLMSKRFLRFAVEHNTRCIDEFIHAFRVMHQKNKIDIRFETIDKVLTSKVTLETDADVSTHERIIAINDQLDMFDVLEPLASDSGDGWE